MLHHVPSWSCAQKPPSLQDAYAAPIGSPESVLNVGSGPGRWAIEMDERFTRAHVVGIDVTLPPPAADTGATWEQPPANGGPSR